MKKVLKLGALVLAIVIIVFTSIGLMLPSDFSNTVTKKVAVSAEAMGTLLATPRSWLNWSPWNTTALPGMQSTFSGPESGVDAKWSWTQEQGDGSLTVTEYEAGEKMSYQLSFEGVTYPMTGTITLTGAGDGVEVAWTYRGEMGGNLMFRWVMFFMGDTMDDEFENAINNLAKAAQTS